MNEILALSGTAQGRLIQKGAISSIELIKCHLDRIDQVNPVLNAAVEILRDQALRGAEAADVRRARGETLSPLDGVPFSIKDSIEVEGTACSAGTLGLQNTPPSCRDATVVARLRKAGAIPIARTNVPDLLFAFETDNLIFGRTNNPYNVDLTPGGSSGGEAALIAACGSPFGLGSDAAGSVRVPAHYCGICSIKPTSGRLPRTGHVPPASGWIEMLWQIGPMARRVEDLWTVLPILIGPDAEDATAIPMPFCDPSQIQLRNLRVAFYTNNGIVPAEPETDAVVRCAAWGLSDEVLSVEEQCPCLVEQSYELEMKLLGLDGGDGLRKYLLSIGSVPVHSLFEGWVSKLERYRTDLHGFAQYWVELDRFRAGMFRFLRHYDIILSPVCAEPAIAHGHSVGTGVFPGFSYAMTYNVTGWPAAVLRCGTTTAGLPIGVQIAAAPWREDIVLAVAHRLEEIF